ncbi:MAG TPA: hypothetical protein VD931_16220 [Baekduia sp.]|nr:hypothetical protein [Baekduia sp.]
MALDGRLPHGAQAIVRLGADAHAARVSWLGGPFHQLRCEGVAGGCRGDRVTVEPEGGPPVEGVVLDPDARRHGTDNDVVIRLRRLLDGLEADAPQADEDVALALDARLRAAGAAPPPDADLPRPELAYLEAAGRAVPLAGARHVHARTFAEAEALARGACQAQGAVDAPALAAALGAAPEVAGALLERLAQERVLEPAGPGRWTLRDPGRPA